MEVIKIIHLERAAMWTSVQLFLIVLQYLYSSTHGLNISWYYLGKLPDVYQENDCEDSERFAYELFATDLSHTTPERKIYDAIMNLSFQ